MGHIIGKVVGIIDKEREVEITLAEHVGLIRTTGVVKLILDRDALYDLWKALGKGTRFTSSPVHARRAAEVFDNKHVAISVL
ncbi:hypothetical protein HYV85_02005 [Candidatus Woesearchaeota archaeon]|nr:hypothetical protein [Candidatus Woesearchaeota archaeon]